MRAILTLALLFAVLLAGAVALSSHGSPARPTIVSANAASGLAAGNYHSCALSESGGVKCWGWNPYGELGDGRQCGFSCPFVMSTTGLESGVASVAAGGYHTCAVLEDGSAKCWGANLSGQLGDSTIIQRLTPVSVGGLAGPVTKITAGYNHTCALTEGGAARCWGDNHYGAVGDGTTLSTAHPTNVAGLSSGVVDIDAGGFSTCAALNDGSVRCWGYNSLGQLGDGTTQDRSAPVTVSGITKATRVSVGVSHACALTSGGGIKCWGSNAEGQLGDGSTTDHSTPIDGGGFTNGITQVAAGGYHTCAITSAGAVKCWGDNPWGQMGDAWACGKLCPSPTDVPGLGSSVTALDAGLRHTCAIEGDGGVTCWGADDTGQLATGRIHQIVVDTPTAPLNVDIKAPLPPSPTPFPTFTRTPTPIGTYPTPTPLGACGASPNSISHGPRVGMTTDHSSSVWVRSCRAVSMTLEYKLADADWSTGLTVGPTATDASADNTLLLALNDLEPSSAYEYRVVVDGQTPQEPLEGSFRTMPPEGEEAAFSFMMGTDLHMPQFPMDTILNSVEQHAPLFGVVGGDTLVSEVFSVPAISRSGYEFSYQIALGGLAFRRFEAQLPLATIWSDHEIYNDWDHRTSPPYTYARAAFDEYLGMGNPAKRDPAGIQYTFKAADIEFYVIDDRTFRSPGEKVDGPSKTMLGAQQKQDLKNWLMTSDARFKFIVSDVWWNNFSGHQAYGESWPAYSSERNELFTFIRDNHIPGVVLISGDEHITGVFRLQPWGLYEIAPGPMSWTPSNALSPNPQILYTAGHTRVFGIFSVDTTACPATLNVSLYNETNTPLYTLPLTERDLGADTDGNGLVPCEEQSGGTATPTRTTSPTPTRTPTPTGARGDANCDGSVNSIDAAIILQVTAGLLPSAPCPQNADVNHDGQINSIDASLVLQYAAGLLDEFP